MFLLPDTEKEEFKAHCEAFFRFTYRKDFPVLDPYAISSDSGWGCMLRSAQMLMGYALRRHYLGSGLLLP
jgi:cysteine protease ATG4